MRSVIVIGVLLVAVSVRAAVTLHATTSSVLLLPSATRAPGIGCVESGGPFNYGYQLLDNSAPASGTSVATSPSATAPPCYFQRSGNDFFVFVSKPLSAGFTISGTITGVCSGAESATTLNSGCSMKLYKYDARRGAITNLIWTSGRTAEFGTSCATKAVGSAATTSTAVSTGDRLVLIPYIENCSDNSVPCGQGSWNGNGTRTSSLCYNGAAGGSNEVSVTLTESLTFSADSSDANATIELILD